MKVKMINGSGVGHPYEARGHDAAGAVMGS